MKGPTPTAMARIKVMVATEDELRLRQIAERLGTHVSTFCREAALDRLAREEQAARLGGNGA